MKLCKKCNKEFEPGKGLLNYCSLKCRNSHDRSEESRNKTSASMKKSKKVKISIAKAILVNTGKEKIARVRNKCPVCNEEIVSTITRNKKYHDKCYKQIAGGYRKNSGRGKYGWYKNYWCQSSYELAFVIYNLEHQISFERNTEGFEYEFSSKKYKFYPDFKIGEKFVEIKGYADKKCEEKIKQFPFELVVLFKKDMNKIFAYVENKYGAEFTKLYEK